MRRRALLALCKNESYDLPIILEYGKYYPELVDALFALYGENYGTRLQPMPFTGNIILNGFFSDINYKVEYISTNVRGNAFSIFLYTANFKLTWCWAKLNDEGVDKGLCGHYYY